MARSQRERKVCFFTDYFALDRVRESFLVICTVRQFIIGFSWVSNFGSGDFLGFARLRFKRFPLGFHF